MVYTTGLGATNPAIADGSITPGTSLTNAVNEVDVYLDGPTSSEQATVAFTGLTPGLIGLYQINFTVPTGVSAGDNILELVGVGTDSTGATYEDTDNFEALISIGSGVGVNAIPEAKLASGLARPHPHPHAQPRAKFAAGKIAPLQGLGKNSLPRHPGLPGVLAAQN